MYSSSENIYQQFSESFKFLIFFISVKFISKENDWHRHLISLYWSHMKLRVESFSCVAFRSNSETAEQTAILHSLETVSKATLKRRFLFQYQAMLTFTLRYFSGNFTDNYECGERYKVTPLFLLKAKSAEWQTEMTLDLIHLGLKLVWRHKIKQSHTHLIMKQS